MRLCCDLSWFTLLITCVARGRSLSRHCVTTANPHSPCVLSPDALPPQKMMTFELRCMRHVHSSPWHPEDTFRMDAINSRQLHQSRSHQVLRVSTLALCSIGPCVAMHVMQVVEPARCMTHCSRRVSPSWSRTLALSLREVIHGACTIKELSMSHNANAAIRAQQHFMAQPDQGQYQSLDSLTRET